MRIIIPMAGMGKRMRPHTLTVPKPLIPVAGKSIVQHLVEDLTALCDEKVEEIAFVVGRFGTEVENNLLSIAKNCGSTGKIYYQDEPKGTAHAIYCAKDALQGKVIVAFADTLFQTRFNVPENCDGVIWVKQIEDPRQFGVVTLKSDGSIADFVEKPQEPVSDLAIIGIYYFKDGENLRSEIEYLLDNNIKDKGEYQITNALENMKSKGKSFLPGKVDEWLDCGNKDATVYTNARILELKKNTLNSQKPIQNLNSVVIEPCYIGQNVYLENAVIGPHVSVGDNVKIMNSVIHNSIIQENSVIRNICFGNTMLGKHVSLQGADKDYSLGDYSTQENA